MSHVIDSVHPFRYFIHPFHILVQDIYFLYLFLKLYLFLISVPYVSLFLIFVPYISVPHNRSVYLLHIYLFRTFIPYICSVYPFQLCNVHPFCPFQFHMIPIPTL